MATSPLYVKVHDPWDDDPPSEATPILAGALDDFESGIWGAYYNTIHQAEAASDAAAVFRGQLGQSEDLVQFVDDPISGTVLSAVKSDGSFEIGQPGQAGTAELLFRSGIDVTSSSGGITTPAGSIVGTLNEYGDLILGLNAGGWNSGSSQSALNNIAFWDFAVLQEQRGKIKARSWDMREVGDTVDALIRRAGDSGYPDGPVMACSSGVGIGHLSWLAAASAAGDPGGAMVTWSTPGQAIASVSAKTVEDSMLLPGDTNHQRSGGTLEFHTSPKFAGVQTLTVTGAPTGGSFTIQLEHTSDSPGVTPETSGAIAWNSSAAALLTVLQAMNNIDPGDISVSGGPFPATPIVVTFLDSGRYGNRTFPAISLQVNSLTGGAAPTMAVTIPIPDYTNHRKAALDHKGTFGVFDGVGNPDFVGVLGGTLVGENGVIGDYRGTKVSIGPFGPAAQGAVDVAGDTSWYREAASRWRTDDAVVIGGQIGFYGHAVAAQPTIVGSRAGNAALASLLTKLAGLGLLIDTTTV